jgi:hypothetical protein
MISIVDISLIGLDHLHVQCDAHVAQILDTQHCGEHVLRPLVEN